MKLYRGGIFHIFNQGNNKRQLFQEDLNFELFEWKMRVHLPPFGKLISWCLMPNHFHWLFHVDNIEIPLHEFRIHQDKLIRERRWNKYGEKAIELKRPPGYYDKKDRAINLNRSIGILLGSYSRAINEHYGWSGSLFKKRCKAKDGWIHLSMDIDEVEGPLQNQSYVVKCFHYIHENPVKAGLVKKAIKYRWSSASAYMNSDPNNRLCDVHFGRKILSDQMSSDLKSSPDFKSGDGFS